MKTAMNKFEFQSVKPGELNQFMLQKLSGMKKTNGLFQVLKYGYSRHIPITLRPDDIMNSVACIWSKYICCHSEKFREFFVDHKDKKKLTYFSAGTYHSDRIPEFMRGLSELVLKDQKKDNISWMQLSASTTTDLDKFIRSVAQLASQKNYYEYGCTLCCGFPSVELLGADEDWDQLQEKVGLMPTPDIRCDEWKARLLDIVSKMRTGDENFWQSCMTLKPYGSGGQQKIKGWALNFNPINEKGEWLDQVDDDDVLDMTVDFEIHIDDNGTEFDVKVEAGPIGVNYGDSLTVRNNFLVEQK